MEETTSATVARDNLLLKFVAQATNNATNAAYERARQYVQAFVEPYMSATVLAFTSREDMIQEGFIGLSKAAKSYRADKGTAFGTYAVRFVQGTLVDHLRRMDGMPRGWTKRGEIKPTVVSLDAKISNGDNDETEDSHNRHDTVPDDTISSPFEWAVESEEVAIIRGNDILAEYADGSLLKDIGARRGVSESRACQLLHGEIDRLREAYALRDDTATTSLNRRPA